MTNAPLPKEPLDRVRRRQALITTVIGMVAEAKLIGAAADQPCHLPLCHVRNPGRWQIFCCYFSPHYCAGWRIFIAVEQALK